jgi:hypothetical protein
MELPSDVGSDEEMVLPSPVDSDDQPQVKKITSKECPRRQRTEKTRTSTTTSVRRFKGSDKRKVDKESKSKQSKSKQSPVAETYLSRLQRRPQAGRADHVLEVFSPPRVVLLAIPRGLRGNLSVDLETGWDLTNPAVQFAVIQELRYRQPVLVVLSPPCTMHSPLQRVFNLHKMSSEVLEKRWAEAHTLLDFAMDVAKAQARGDRYYVFEHPDRASSWERSSVVMAQQETRASVARFDQCRFGLRSPAGTQPMKKTTCFMSNMPAIINAFNGKRCSCKERHLAIQGSEAGHRVSTFAQRYPEPLVQAILDALQAHLANVPAQCR